MYGMSNAISLSSTNDQLLTLFIRVKFNPGCANRLRTMCVTMGKLLETALLQAYIKGEYPSCLCLYFQSDLVV